MSEFPVMSKYLQIMQLGLSSTRYRYLQLFTSSKPNAVPFIPLASREALLKLMQPARN